MRLILTEKLKQEMRRINSIKRVLAGQKLIYEFIKRMREKVAINICETLRSYSNHST